MWVIDVGIQVLNILCTVLVTNGPFRSICIDLHCCSYFRIDCWYRDRFDCWSGWWSFRWNGCRYGRIFWHCVWFIMRTKVYTLLVGNSIWFWFYNYEALKLNIGMSSLLWFCMKFNVKWHFEKVIFNWDIHVSEIQSKESLRNISKEKEYVKEK